MDVRDFDRKTKALQDLAERGKLVKTQPSRDPTVTKLYRKNILDAVRIDISNQTQKSMNS